MYNFVGYTHRHGKSKKTGNDYDFYQCFFTHDLPSDGENEGKESISLNIDSPVFYHYDLAGHIGENCEIMFSRFGRVESIKF